AVLTNYVKAIRYLQGIEHNGESFTIRDWMRGVREDQKNGWLFISSNADTHIAGLLMLAVSHRLYRAEDRTERLALVACLLAVIPALNLASSDVAAVAGLVMTVLTVGLVSCAGKSLPRFWPGDFFPTFYACHLAVLGVLAL
ncbi:TPA: TraX family protein, partial [Escherichia coli]